MVMMGLELTDKSPFHTIYMHGEHLSLKCLLLFSSLSTIPSCILLHAPIFLYLMLSLSNTSSQWIYESLPLSTTVYTMP